MAVWAERDGCGTDAEQAPVQGDVSVLRFPCPDGVDVELYVVQGGGHTWPGATTNPPNEILASAVRDFGKTSEVSANRLMWRFFAAHPLTDGP
jgi:polyhydroxybutyrate depolymerase